jgi:hypothetical protein
LLGQRCKCSCALAQYEDALTLDEALALVRGLFFEVGEEPMLVSGNLHACKFRRGALKHDLSPGYW